MEPVKMNVICNNYDDIVVILHDTVVHAIERGLEIEELNCETFCDVRSSLVVTKLRYKGSKNMEIEREKSSVSFNGFRSNSKYRGGKS